MTHATLPEAAFDYRSRGLSVIPVGHNKKPLVDWKKYQIEAPHPDQVCEWWTRWPKANPAIVTGAVSAIVVLDADGLEGLASLKALSTPATTWLSRTGRLEGGWQQSFRHPCDGARIPNRAGLRPHLDVRGDGGYVILPPSVHASGRRYEWLTSPSDVPLAPLPALLLELLATPPMGTNGATPSGVDAILKGQRNDRLYRLARSLAAKHLRREAILAAMLEENRARCTPPLPDREVQEIVDHAITQPHRPDFRRRDVAYAEPPAWPALQPTALHGVAGEFVRLVAPHTEADPAALLTQFLVMFGNMIGRGPHVLAEADRHYTNLFEVLIGVTSKGRKGTSQGQTRAPFRTIDEVWAQNRLLSGLSSGEGLMWAVRDPIEKQESVKQKGRVVDYETVITDEGVSDKRLLVFESEFASVLRILGREGNTLSAVIRQAWDTGTLRSLTKNSPAKATDAHISIVGHITQDELLRYLDRTEAGNGFANRFLWVCVKRARALPDGGELHTVDFAPFLRRLSEAVDFTRKLGDTPVGRDRAARALWHKVYEALSEGCPGLLGAVTSRAEAQVLRLSLIYALLDQSAEIRLPHLRAALALWNYCDASARYVFGEALGDPVADEILAALRAHPRGMTRNEVRDLFGRNRAADQIGRALTLLVKQKLARWQHEQTGGRPAERWFAVGARHRRYLGGVGDDPDPNPEDRPDHDVGASGHEDEA